MFSTNGYANLYVSALRAKERYIDLQHFEAAVECRDLEHYYHLRVWRRHRGVNPPNLPPKQLGRALELAAYVTGRVRRQPDSPVTVTKIDFPIGIAGWVRLPLRHAS